jgi:uncharacterized membrane protein
MNTSLILCLAFAIGVVAGLRAFTAPTVVCWAAYLGWINLHGSHLAFLGSIITAVIFTLLAIFELVNDKLPKTPNRTTPGPLGFRILTGGLSGGALAIAGAQGVVLGVILGTVGAVAGTFGGYQARHQIVTGLKIKDIGVALAEDLVAIGGALLIVTRF